MNRLSIEDYNHLVETKKIVQVMRTNPRHSEVTEPSRCEAQSDKVERKARRDRYAENAGELGKKIFAHREQMKGSIRLWLPYPPSTNARMANVGGRMLKTAEARSYQKVIQESLVDITPLTGDLEVTLTINRPRRRGDIDNVMKNIFDALTGIAFIDDEQIAMIDAKRYDGTYAKEFPGVQIQITAIK